jgi:hypothetical protein
LSFYENIFFAAQKKTINKKETNKKSLLLWRRDLEMRLFSFKKETNKKPLSIGEGLG